jgi:hypothetical protein
METKKPRTSKKATITTEQLSNDIEETRLWREYLEAQKRLFTHLNVPHWSRAITAVIASMLFGLGVGYSVSWMTEAIALSAITLSASSVFSMVLWCVGIVLAVYASIQASSIAFDYIVGRRIDQHWHAFTTWTRRRFA